MIFNWSAEKNELLKKQRGVCFEDVELAVTNNQILEIRDHPNQELYPDQKIYILNLKNYIYMVPFVINQKAGNRFLKTIIPSRKLKKEFL